MNPMLFLIFFCAALFMLEVIALTVRYLLEKKGTQDRLDNNQFFDALEASTATETAPPIHITLLGGPLDGTELLMPKDSIGYCDEETRSCYYFSPEATALAGRYVFAVADREMIS